MPDSQLTFAEASLLHLDRVVRECDAMREALRHADEHLLHAESLMNETRMPPTIKIWNANVQSIGVSLVNTNDGLAVRIGGRIDDENEHVVAPGKSIELRLDGK